MNYTPEMYEQKLNEFFDRHDPLNKHLSSEIVSKFPDRQEDVFKHLTAVYAKKEGTLEQAMNQETILSIPPKANTGVG
ncbi:hypothetical protein [Brumimicrobium oceani]|uniref:Uncharacterized protein n=1 Tax=Brumimicrobium oceani TaxID=2100725 RepID=A0A2U2XH78_9FLAO|nr:hypothetical protein [Brumimicrobium oceani]PWH87090.1 hypothetical protein DIT68_02170 [Brumimicrobium oceani]